MSIQNLISGSSNKNFQNSNSSVTLLVNNSLMKSSFLDYLGSGFKIKGSDVTPKDSIIMSHSAVAILLIYCSKTQMGITRDGTNSLFSNLPSQDQRGDESDSETTEQLIERLKNVDKNHRKTIVVMVSAVFGEEELSYMTSQLMLKLLPRSPLFLVAHGEAQAACHIQLIAKATRVEARRIVHSRILESIDTALSQDINQYLATIMGLSEHEMSVLMDTFRGSLKAVAGVASSDEIHRRTPLDKSTAEGIFNFLNKDTIVV